MKRSGLDLAPHDELVAAFAKTRVLTTNNPARASPPTQTRQESQGKSTTDFTDGTDRKSSIRVICVIRGFINGRQLTGRSSESCGDSSFVGFGAICEMVAAAVRLILPEQVV